MMKLEIPLIYKKSWALAKGARLKFALLHLIFFAVYAVAFLPYFYAAFAQFLPKQILIPAITNTQVQLTVMGVSYLIALAVAIYLSKGLVYIMLKHSRNEEWDISEMFINDVPLGKYIGLNLLFSLIILGGTLLLIVPGIIFLLMFLFSAFIFIDQNTGVIDSLKGSKKLTHGYRFELFIHYILFFLIATAITYAPIIIFGVPAAILFALKIIAGGITLSVIGLIATAISYVVFLPFLSMIFPTIYNKILAKEDAIDTNSANALSE